MISVKVDVIGSRKSGKSTVLKVIKNALERDGFKVSETTTPRTENNFEHSIEVLKLCPEEFSR